MSASIHPTAIVSSDASVARDVSIAPPPSVPRFTVMNSRKTLSLPMTSSVRSPLNLMSCGGVPNEDWPTS